MPAMSRKCRLTAPESDITCPIEMRCGRHSPRRRAASRKSPPSFISIASTLAVPAGSTPSGTWECDHAFGHFVEGAIAAGGQNQVRAALDLLPSQRAGGTGTGGGAARHAWPSSSRIRAALAISALPFRPNLPAHGIINQDGLAVGGDGEFSRFLVRL